MMVHFVALAKGVRQRSVIYQSKMKTASYGTSFQIRKMNHSSVAAFMSVETFEHRLAVQFTEQYGQIEYVVK